MRILLLLGFSLFILSAQSQSLTQLVDRPGNNYSAHLLPKGQLITSLAYQNRTFRFKGVDYYTATPNTDILLFNNIIQPRVRYALLDGLEINAGLSGSISSTNLSDQFSKWQYSGFIGLRARLWSTENFNLAIRAVQVLDQPILESNILFSKNLLDHSLLNFNAGYVYHYGSVNAVDVLSANLQLMAGISRQWGAYVESSVIYTIYEGNYQMRPEWNYGAGIYLNLLDNLQLDLGIGFGNLEIFHYRDYADATSYNAQVGLSWLIDP